MLLRKKFLINPAFQIRVITLMMGLALAPISIFFAAHHFYFQKLRTLGEDVQLPADHVYFKFIDSQSLNMFWIFLICSAVAMLVIFFLGLFLSHRIAGPIHHMKEHLRMIKAGGEVKDLSFRANDYFTELPAFVNDAVKTLKEKK